MMEQIRKEEIAKDRWIREHLREIAEDKNDLQENFTPLEVCDMMLDKVDLNSAKSILVLYNIEIVFALRMRDYKGEVTFFTSSLKKCEIAPKFLPGIKVEYIEKSKDPLQHLTMAFPDKFDIVIANPPYSKKLDLKFLDKAFDIAKDEVVFVHPSSFLVDQKKSLEIYTKTLEKVGKFIKSIKLFNGNGIFDIGLYVPCSITHISKKKESNYFQFDYPQYKQSFKLENSKISEISVFGYSNHFSSIKNKIKAFLKNQGSENLETRGFVLGSGKEDQRFLRNQDSFFVEMSHITAGNNRGEHVKFDDPIHKHDFFISISKYQTVVKRGIEPKYNIWFEFDSIIQAPNFLNYLKTDFFRICLSLSKTNQHLSRGEFRMIPWLDFTQDWTDEKLYAHFGINQEEQSFIKEVIPNWYD
jgi:hypothetical protein